MYDSVTEAYLVSVAITLGNHTTWYPIPQYGRRSCVSVAICVAITM